MRALRAAAWAVFSLDLVVFAQLLYDLLAPSGEPDAQALVRGLALMLGSGLAGVAIVLAVSSWLRSRVGLWVSLVCGALPLLWVLSAMIQRQQEIADAGPEIAARAGDRPRAAEKSRCHGREHGARHDRAPRARLR